jgi:hypothetical protein
MVESILKKRDDSAIWEKKSLNVFRDYGGHRNGEMKIEDNEMRTGC